MKTLTSDRRYSIEKSNITRQLVFTINERAFIKRDWKQQAKPLTASLGVVGRMPLKMRVHERESIAMALRRFKKLLERSGIQKELRKRKYYEKPCEARRRSELRRLSSIRKARSGSTKS